MASTHRHPEFQRSKPNTDTTVDVVCAVADLENARVSDLPLLTEAIDPDALNDYIASTDSGKVTFEYAGYQIVVTADGGVTADPADGKPKQCQTVTEGQ